MIKLRPTSAHYGLRLPVTLDTVEIAAVPVQRIIALAPYPGQLGALRAMLGGFPSAGQIVTLGDLRLVWAGRDMVFAFGDKLPEGLAAHCAMTDQSDGWAGLSLGGPNASAFLARRLPFDLRALPANSSARSLIGHVPVLVVKADDLQLWVWRSMLRSIVEELAPV